MSTQPRSSPRASGSGGSGTASRPRSRGVRRRNVVFGALVAAVVVAGIVTLAESLRHPLPNGNGLLQGGLVPAAQEDLREGDPRVEVECPDPLPADPDGDEGPAFGQRSPVEVSSSDLHDCPKSYDRALVTFEGEAVGSVMRRDAGAWVQLNDDVYADASGPLPAHRDYRGGNDGVGVLLPLEVADQIGVVGGPGYQGDLVAVTGTFHRVHPVYGDVVVIQAQSAEVIREGAPFEDARLPYRELAAALLAVLAVGLVAAERYSAVRWRRG